MMGRRLSPCVSHSLSAMVPAVVVIYFFSSFLSVKGKNHSLHCFQAGLSQFYSGNDMLYPEELSSYIYFFPPVKIHQRFLLGQKAVLEYLKLFYLSSYRQNVVL